MAYRPTWQGHLKLSLVTCPVALYTAVNSAGDVHFNLINPKTNNRIRMVTTDPDTGPVDRSSLVKGYEVSKGEYVILTDEEIRSVRLESTKTIDIERFVPEDEIDRIYWDHPYYLAPDGKLAQEAYAVIREAMREAGQIALGRVTLSTRERLLALEPRDRGIVAWSLRSEAEVRSSKEIFSGVSDAPPDPAMISIAQKIIEQQEGPFDTSLFVDRYEDALKALIESKRKGQPLVSASEPEDDNVIDLMEALRRSLQGRAAPPAAAKAPAKASAKSGGGAKASGAGAAAKPAPKPPAKSAAKTKTETAAPARKPARPSAAARTKAAPRRKAG